MEGGVCRQFEVPPLAAVVAPLAVAGGVGEVGWGAEGPWELGEPWEGVAGLGREEEVAGRVAGLGALSLTDSHSDAPLVLVPSEGVGAVGKVSRLQAGWTRYLRGRGPFCRERGGEGVRRKRLMGQPPTFTPRHPNREKGRSGPWRGERLEREEETRDVGLTKQGRRDRGTQRPREEESARETGDRKRREGGQRAEGEVHSSTPSWGTWSAQGSFSPSECGKSSVRERPEAYLVCGRPPWTCPAHETRDKLSVIRAGWPT